ncbi:MAG: disulfide bond formation protein B [Ponticaulis sp.]|nr:disulfide bond formation protein B [Ponticaulis sp.]MBN02616.1 disulfide bond formation protein B [Ponticaulis sp.]
MPEMKLKPESWPVLAFIASAALIAGAHAFERFGHYLPCELCLRQREIHWAAMTIAAIGFVVVKRWSTPRLLGAVNVLLFLIFMTSLVVAAYHAGVEWEIFEGPSGCSSTAGGASASNIPTGIPSFEDLNRPIGTVSCDVAAWRLFGISMAGYNALISLVLAGASAFFATKALARADKPSDPVY